MAQNDMHVIVFKILSYIYDCMKQGIEVDTGKISWKSLNVPESYWTQVMGQVIERGYVTGVEVIMVSNGKPLVDYRSPSVTLDGVEFLMSNSMMAKAARFVADAGGFFGSIVSPFV